MPRDVDAEARRRAIAEAAWRVIRNQGLEAASVRNIAREAGLSMGSLRYCFGSQRDLLKFSMGLVGERVQERLRALAPSADPAEAARRIADELLPLDDERRAEADVWLAFLARSRVDAGLGELTRLVDEGLRSVLGRAYDALEAGGAVAAGLDRRLEVERLYALIDGLALHATTRPGRLGPEDLRRVLDRHLESLRPAQPQSVGRSWMPGVRAPHQTGFGAHPQGDPSG